MVIEVEGYRAMIQSELFEQPRARSRFLDTPCVEEGEQSLNSLIQSIARCSGQRSPIYRTRLPYGVNAFLLAFQVI